MSTKVKTRHVVGLYWWLSVVALVGWMFMFTTYYAMVHMDFPAGIFSDSVVQYVAERQNNHWWGLTGGCIVCGLGILIVLMHLTALQTTNFYDQYERAKKN